MVFWWPSRLSREFSELDPDVSGFPEIVYSCHGYLRGGEKGGSSWDTHHLNSWIYMHLCAQQPCALWHDKMIPKRCGYQTIDSASSHSSECGISRASALPFHQSVLKALAEAMTISSSTSSMNICRAGHREGRLDFSGAPWWAAVHRQNCPSSGMPQQYLTSSSCLKFIHFIKLHHLWYKWLGTSIAFEKDAPHISI